MALSDAELERYARHIALREIGGPGQARLRAASALVVGAGGLGAPVLLYLAAAGVGRIVLADDDVVSLSNLQRQVLFTTDDVGRPKARAAAERLSALNPHVAIDAMEAKLDAAATTDLTAAVDVIVDGSDSWQTRLGSNAAALATDTPLVFGALSAWEGQVAVLTPGRGPCLACLFPKPPIDDAGCAAGGVVGPVAGVVASMMAVETIARLAGVDRPSDRLTIYDGLTHETRAFSVRRRPCCAACGGEAG